MFGPFDDRHDLRFLLIDGQVFATWPINVCHRRDPDGTEFTRGWWGNIGGVVWTDERLGDLCAAGNEQCAEHEGVERHSAGAFSH